MLEIQGSGPSREQGRTGLERLSAPESFATGTLRGIALNFRQASELNCYCLLTLNLAGKVPGMCNLLPETQNSGRSGSC